MRSQVVLEGLADRLFDGLLELDHERRIAVWNAAATRITGCGPDHVIGLPYRQSPARHISEGGLELPDVLVPLLMTVQDGVPRDAIGYLNHSDGYRLTTITRTAPIHDRRGRLIAAAEIFSDNKALIAAFEASRKTEETVRFDPLTGIGNRTHIEVKIRSAMEDYRLQKKPFGILFIDVDHFKDFNDSHGHLIGDKILRLTANTLRQNLRGSDSCGRWGGEEFVALVYDLDCSGLAKVAEKLRQRVSDTRIQEKEQELFVTISIGASLVRPADTVQTLLERADRLMYESKRQGRNRVTID